MSRVPDPDLSGTAEPPKFADARWRTVARHVVPFGVRMRARRLLNETRVSELWTRLDSRMTFTRITSETRLVIDGFPRSANTYSTMAFLHANGADFPLSSHRHSFQAIRTGVRKGIPAIVLIREPGPAIASSLEFSPETPPSMPIVMYKSYYEGVLPVLPHTLVTTFEEVISDLGDVIRRCNTKFGTDFIPYKKNAEAEAEVMQMIDRWTMVAYGRDELHDKLSRPSERHRSLDDMLARFGPADEAALHEAEALYRHVVEHRSG